MSTNRRNIYWYCQIIGWSVYIIINAIYTGISSSLSFRDYLLHLFLLGVGVGLSHGNRFLIQRIKLMDRAIPLQILYILVSGTVNGILYSSLAWVFISYITLNEVIWDLYLITSYIINISLVFCTWNFIYLGFKYFEGFKKSEIEALKYLALNKESELNSLKAQLNPHFIFNCLNSIRALVDEDPERSKRAVTRLSNILRKTLQLDKNREIRLFEEMELVNDYLALERIRYEERLRVEIKVDPSTFNCLIPPFIIQSQVENAVKHGVAKVLGGGTIEINIEKIEDALKIVVFNTGTLNHAKPETGVGFINSKQRLNILYGPKGSISLQEVKDGISVEIFIPIIIPTNTEN